MTSLQDGCFLLKIPDGLDLRPGAKMAREFYLDPSEIQIGSKPSYRGFRQKTGIYFNRDNYQTEHILIDGPGQRDVFPDRMNEMCQQMYMIGRQILRAVLTVSGIDKRLWSQATDRCITGGGVEWFAGGCCK